MKRLREPGEPTTQAPSRNPWGTDSPSLDLYVSVRLALTENAYFGAALLQRR